MLNKWVIGQKTQGLVVGEDMLKDLRVDTHDKRAVVYIDARLININGDPDPDDTVHAVP